MSYSLEIQTIEPIYKDFQDYKSKGKVYAGINVFYIINYKLHSMHGECLIEQHEQPEKMSLNQIQERVKFELHNMFK